MAPARWLVAFSAALAACHGAGASDMAVGPDLATPPICTDPVVPDAGVPSTLANVQRIFDSQCTVCHCCNGEVNLAPGQSYAALVNQMSPDPVDSCGGTLVVPYNAAGSYLYVKVSSDTPCGGQRMPRGEFGSVPLQDCHIDLIRRWIAAGAPND